MYADAMTAIYLAIFVHGKNQPDVGRAPRDNSVIMTG